jgi:hypothetical protein
VFGACFDAHVEAYADAWLQRMTRCSSELATVKAKASRAGHAVFQAFYLGTVRAMRPCRRRPIAGQTQARPGDVACRDTVCPRRPTAAARIACRYSGHRSCATPAVTWSDIVELTALRRGRVTDASVSRFPLRPASFEASSPAITQAPPSLRTPLLHLPSATATTRPHSSKLFFHPLHPARAPLCSAAA